MKRGLIGLGGYLWRHRSACALGMLCLFIADFGQLSVPLFMQRVIDALTTDTATPAFLARQAGWVMAMGVLCYAARYAWRYFFFTAARQAEVDLRHRLLSRLVRLPMPYFQTTRTGEVMALATNDVMAVRMALAFGLMAGFDGIVYGLMTLGAMFWLDWRLTLWTLAPFPLLGVVMIVFMPISYGLSDKVQKAFEDVTEKARESLAGMRVLRAYSQEQGDFRDFVRICSEYREIAMRYVRVDAIYGPVILVLSGSSVAILLAAGGSQVVGGATTLGTFTAFTSYLGHLTWPMIALGWTLSIVQRGAASMNRLQTLLEQTPEPVQDRVENPRQGRLQARGLTFAYPGRDTPALVDLSFDVPPGGSLGLVGEVGSGKSTLTQLLTRLFDPPKGTLFLDGVDVTDYNLTELREQISLVQQEAFLFSQTIAENLQLAKPHASLEELERVARLAALHDEVLEFPQRYDTRLGERGVTLSGGQRQRVCLARALLKDAPVLVLDDTLSAVDAETEHRIAAALKGRLQGQTSVVISHRISSVKDLDWILVLHDGHVLQQGRHADLVGQPGLYRELYELQTMEEAKA